MPEKYIHQIIIHFRDQHGGLVWVGCSSSKINDMQVGSMITQSQFHLYFIICAIHKFFSSLLRVIGRTWSQRINWQLCVLYCSKNIFDCWRNFFVEPSIVLARNSRICKFKTIHKPLLSNTIPTSRKLKRYITYHLNDIMLDVLIYVWFRFLVSGEESDACIWPKY